MTKTKSVLLLFALLTANVYAQIFNHPGLLHTRADIERVRQQIADKTEPVWTAYQALQADSRSQADYKMAAPYDTIARDGRYSHTKRGSEADCMAAYLNALRYVLGDGDEYGETAINIVRTYAHNLKYIDGHDATLAAGLQGFVLVNAAELIRYNHPQWTDADSRDTELMLRKVFLPVLDRFRDASPYANGNWGAIANKMRMAIGVFCDNEAIYSEAIDYYLNGYDNGALPQYVTVSGQCQETGRDQAHALLGLGTLAEQCEVAWNQGTDLYGALDKRLMAGFEYAAKYNLGWEVPFEQWKDLTGLYCDWTEPGAMARGVKRNVWEIAYNHYAGRCNLPMPYTAMALGHGARPEISALGCDNTGYASLMHYRNTTADTETRTPKVKDESTLHTLYTYPAPKGAPRMNTYKVQARAKGGEWQTIDTYEAKANVGIGDNKHRVCSYSYGFFDFTGVVDVEITTSRPYRSARVRPDYRGVIANQVNDTTLRFMLFQPENVSVEFDGDITNNLLLFTNHPIDDESRLKTEDDKQLQWKKKGHTFISFGKGYHTLADTLRLPSHATLYIADGAYIDGVVLLEDIEDARVIGRGVIRPSKGREGLKISRCKNIEARGFVTTQCPIGGSDGVRVEDVKSLTHYGWGDGLNVFASSNVKFHRVFCRNSDDCTTVYATRKGYNGSSRNVEMTNSVLWADVAHPIFIGIHGDSQRMDTCANIRYDNIDILCQSEPQIDYQGCMAINCGDNNFIHDVEFNNIRIESLHQGSLVNLRVCFNSKYCTAPGRSIENIRFSHIRYTGAQPEYSIITGYNEQRKIKGVHFKDIRINGLRIYDKMPNKPAWYQTWDMMRCFVGNHVEDVIFEK